MASAFGMGITPLPAQALSGSGLKQLEIADVHDAQSVKVMPGLHLTLSDSTVHRSLQWPYNVLVSSGARLTSIGNLYEPADEAIAVVVQNDARAELKSDIIMLARTGIRNAGTMALDDVALQAEEAAIQIGNAPGELGGAIPLAPAAIRIANSRVGSGSGPVFVVMSTDSAVGNTAAIIELTGTTYAKGGNGALLEVARSASDTMVDLNLRDHARGVGDIRLTGSDLGATQVTLNMSGRATWQGRTDAVDTLLMRGASRWLMTGDSAVGTLHMRDHAAIAFQPAAGGAFRTLRVRGDLLGSGRFEMNTDIAHGRGDRLSVQGKVEGTHGLLVRDSGHAPPAADEGLLLVQAGGGGGGFELENRGGMVEAGPYLYELRRDDPRDDGATTWRLVRAVRCAAPSDTVTSRSMSTAAPAAATATPRAKAMLAPTAKVAIDNATPAAAQALWSTAMNGLRLRLNALRADAGEPGLWIRALNSRQSIDGLVGSGMSQTVTGFGAGMDRSFAAAGLRWHVGVLAGQMRAHRNLGTDGGGSTTSPYAGFYAAAHTGDGAYASAVLTGARFHHRLVARGTDGTRRDLSYSNPGAGIALEGGKRFELPRAWFVEPYAGVDYLRTGAARYRTGHGMQVRDAGAASVGAYAGTRLGKTFAVAGGTFKTYALLAWRHELAGGSTVCLNDERFDARTAGGRFETGAGIEATLGKRHRLYADYTYARGPHFQQPWAVSTGYRYSW
jgi:outer membrane autotransporter protein